MSDAQGRAWPAGWYADPWFDGQARYWDGQAWTPHVRAHAPSWSGAAGTAAAADAPEWGAPLTGWAGDGGPGWGQGVAQDPYAPPWASPAGGGGWLQAPPPGPEPLHRRGRWVALGAVVVVVAVAAAAITVATGSGRPKRLVARPGAASGPTTPAPPTTIPPAASTDPSAGLLSGLDVAQGDAPAGDTVSLLQGGNLVVGQVTLDLCNGTFASESLRTARRQVDLTDRAGNPVLSSEAVLYTSPSATQQAFTELKARAANCPQTFLPPPPGESGLPPSKTTFAAPPDTAWPSVAGVDRLAYAFTTTDQQGNTENSMAVYLRHGRAFLGLYFSNPAQTTAAIAGKTTVEGIVGVFEQRLASLPGSAVNATVPPLPTGGI